VQQWWPHEARYETVVGSLTTSKTTSGVAST
jgi:hypothetical protein